MNSERIFYETKQNHIPDDIFPFCMAHSIYLPENSKMEQIVNGSIRSASTISSRDCERNANLVRYISNWVLKVVVEFT